MSIRIISEGVYDTAHAVYEAHEIKKQKPDAVFLELPSDPFQKILDSYSKGKLSVSALKKKLLKEIKASKKNIDHDLLKKFLLGQLEEDELASIETEGREIHVMQEAKKAGARLHAMDVPLQELEKVMLKQFDKEHVVQTKAIIQTQQLPDILWKISNILHYPFYILERIMRHNALVTTNPYKNNVSDDKVAKLGVMWDRMMHKLILPMFFFLPISKGLRNDMKLSLVIHSMDRYRERYMARRISGEYRRLKKKLKREPRILAIVHLWNANTIRKYLRGLE